MHYTLNALNFNNKNVKFLLSLSYKTLCVGRNKIPATACVDESVFSE